MVSRLSASLLLSRTTSVWLPGTHRGFTSMYAGRVVESGTSKEIFGQPCHPYTISLLKCVPRLDEEAGRKLVPIRGMPPSLRQLGSTCALHLGALIILRDAELTPSPRVEVCWRAALCFLSCRFRHVKSRLLHSLSWSVDRFEILPIKRKR